jgi:hypothetical protein
MALASFIKMPTRLTLSNVAVQEARELLASWLARQHYYQSRSKQFP